MATIADLVNFTQEAQTITTTQTLNMWVCGVCKSNDVSVNQPGNGIIQAVCNNCGTIEIEPAPPQIAQQQTQAQFKAVMATPPQTTTQATT